LHPPVLLSGRDSDLYECKPREHHFGLHPLVLLSARGSDADGCKPVGRPDDDACGGNPMRGVGISGPPDGQQLRRNLT
jgi:hypothetical protein